MERASTTTMNDVAYFGFKEWVGNADLDTVKRHGLAADLRYPL
jgi:hypothetical protein